MPEASPQITETLIEKLKAEKFIANELQKRKHEDWNDNYDLDRGKVRTNRLTQRQAVCIPLMKETRKTLLSKIDEPPNVEWKEKNGDEDKEIVFQEIWDSGFRENKLELVDIQDKNNVLMYGLGTKKLSISSSGVSIYALDVWDIVYDPLMSPSDIETARFVVHQNIFKSVREILADVRYTQKGKDELKIWINSVPGITQSADNRKHFDEKMKRLKDMGVKSSDFPLFAGGDRLVNLTEHYTLIWDTEAERWERRVVVYADEQVILLEESLEDLMGVDFWPFVIWSEDPTTNDIYPDAVADMVRIPNKILNVWYSQGIENRTLKNFQMHWFLPSQGYTPQTYTPGPGVMLPAPPAPSGTNLGINDMIKPVEISGLDDSFEAINFLTQIVERGTGATAIEKGEPEKGVQTLGEVQVLVGKAMERTIGMRKFYAMAWYETAWKWAKLMHANAPKIIELYKVGRSGKVYTKKILKSDWMGDYEPLIRSTSEQEQESLKSLQKFGYVTSKFPQNIALQKISLNRMLESLDLTPEELKQVEEDQVRSELATQQPQEAPDVAEMEAQLGELQTLAS